MEKINEKAWPWIANITLGAITGILFWSYANFLRGYNAKEKELIEGRAQIQALTNQDQFKNKIITSLMNDLKLLKDKKVNDVVGKYIKEQ